MEEKTPGRRKQKNNSLIFLLAGGFILILAVSMAALTAKTPVKGGNNEGNTSVPQTAQGEIAQLTAVIAGRDEAKAEFTLRSITDGQDISLRFTEGSALLDKYGKNILPGSLKTGEIVEAAYDKDTSVIASLKIWDKAWRYEGISNWSVNREEGRFTIADRLYRYSDFLFITRDGKSRTLEELDSTDELIALGVDKMIYSIIVTKGHGTLRFMEYDDFLGGTVYIGKKEVLPVEEDMVVTVREGEYEITMEKGSLTGTKTVQVLPDKETEVDMGEFKKPPIQTGRVTFHITPPGAELYLDDLLVSYDDPVEVEYGEHSMKVTLGGYKPYTGTLNVNEEEKDIFIKLAASDNSGESTAEEDEDGTGENNGEVQSGTDSSDTDSGSDNTDTEGDTSSGTKNYVYIQTPEDASVYVNGEFKGIVPVSFPKTAGQLYITFIQSGYDTKTYTVEVKDDKEDVELNFPDMVSSQ